MAARLAGLQGTLVRLSRDLSVQGTGWAWVSRRSGPSRRRPDWRHAHVCRVMATGSPGSLGDAHVSRVLTLDSGLNTRRTCAFSRSEPDGPLNTRLTCADSSAPGTSASSSVETSGPRRDSPCATLVEPSRGHAGRALSRPGDVVRAGSWARRSAASALRADPGRRVGCAEPGRREGARNQDGGGRTQGDGRGAWRCDGRDGRDRRAPLSSGRPSGPWARAACRMRAARRGRRGGGPHAPDLHQGREQRPRRARRRW